MTRPLSADVQAEVALSFNDDFFLLRPHHLSDFYSSMYGTIIRFDDGVSRKGG